MTFNVYCEFCDLAGEYDPWELRLEHFADIFARHDPDLIALQELAPRLLIPSNVEQLLAARGAGFEAVTFGPIDDPPNPDSTLMFRSARFELLDHGEYWLSPTPDEPLSKGFSDKQALARYVVWARLRERPSGRELYAVSTHFDNNSPAQKLSAPLVVERTRDAAQALPVLIMGDFNSRPDSAAYATLTGSDPRLTDSYQLCPEPRAESNQLPDPQLDASARIDHIFVGGAAEWTCSRWVEDQSVYGPEARFPSDHFPVVIKASF
jgi:endonuclease/exonuclease/phosphatase family metal-dependent hydrolase